MKFERWFLLLLHGLLIWQAAGQVAVTCSCDLTGNACDANCCCDSDCTADDINVFQCSTDAYNEDSRLCVNELVYVNNAPSTVQQSSSGAFCIVTQRDTSWNFYTDPQYNITTSEAFTNLQEQYSSFTYDVSSPTESSTTVYQSGDTIDVRYTSNNLAGMFSFPVSGPTGLCLDYNPASFFNDQATSCARRFADLAAACVNGSSLDPYSYFSTFEIATSPINSSDAASGSYIQVTICDGVDPSILNYDAATGCENVPTSISYIIRYDGGGISSACVSFPAISTASSTLLQSYSIAYVADETVENATEARSGNPGYVVGYPLRTGILGTDTVTLDTSLLTLLSPDTDGSCPSTVSQNQISFKEDSRTGCIIPLNNSRDCNELDNTIRSLLNIPGTTGRVAQYGNTLTNATSDGSWVQIVVGGSTLPVSGNTTSSPCENVVVGIDYSVLYANTGSLSNPQPQVVGAQYALVTKSVQFECIGNSCMSSSSTDITQDLEISSSVTFTDVSLLPEQILRVRPTIDARLSADFFYPFTVVSNP